ncbi:hypothetical protein CERSUDRAFT_111514 [Gelatoporia subvermispora B]|uniref:PABS domain-containing protein n=1 Tax=Ceriporiopsis subvermispora (strain B) TaxID=914234 RepID=M2QV31_CERS8|nr:hypothetical protein CERSUDRAFT_111514 [Gelatoporia subvermispora B]
MSSHNAQRRPSVFLNALSKAASVIVLVALSLVTFAYRRYLEPLYGSGPTNHHFTKVVWAACIAGSFGPTLPILPATLTAGLLLLAMPNSAYWVAVYSGRLGDPVWGPVITHLVVIAPVLYIGVTLVKALQQSVDQEDAQAGPQQIITLPICQTAITSLQGLWPAIAIVNESIESDIFLHTGTLAILTWAIWPFIPSFETPKAPVQVTAPQDTKSTTGKTKQQRKKAPEKTTSATQPAAPPTQSKAVSQRGAISRSILVPLLPVLTMTILRSPTLSKPLTEPYYHPSYPLRILSSAHSTFSNVVVVGEALPPSSLEQPVAGIANSLRYLRAGHSLLGGVWIGPKVHVDDDTEPLRDEAGEPLGDSIYSTFVLQEAARMSEKPNGEPRESALIIGLGAGISATAFMRHNVSTTIVEIDPEVYNAAKRFFGLPTPDQVFVEDVRKWTRLRRHVLEGGSQPAGGEVLRKEDIPKYDIIVHDCFSGGSLPAHLFTQQLWKDLKAVLEDDGVLAVNFGGILSSESFRSIALTLTSVFDTCRIYHDSLQPASEEVLRDDFLNWVFFCSSSSKLAFRKSRTSDYLGSPLRQRVLSTLPKREYPLQKVLSEVSETDRSRYLLTDEKNPLIGMQEESSMKHWTIMRQVLPDVFWETY